MAGKKDIVEQALKLVAGEGEQAAKTGIRAYHGSPHDFDKFDMSKIGTGEGAQAYGHGLYKAQKSDIGRGYRDSIMAAQGIDPEMKIGKTPINDFYNNMEQRLARIPARQAEEGYNQLALLEDLAYGGDVLYIREKAAQGAYSPQTMDWFEKTISPQFNRKGRLYEVNINADPNAFLDWDKPLSEQPEAIKKLFPSVEEAKSLDAQMDKLSADVLANPDDKALQVAWDEAYRNPRQKMARMVLNDFNPKLGGKFSSGNQLYSAIASKPSEASSFLKEAGIPGIKYLDAGSRGTVPPTIKPKDGKFEVYWGNDPRPVDTFATREAAEAAAREIDGRTRNYVVFDDKLISIIRKYGIAGASAMLGYNLMENLDSDQAQAASAADKEYRASQGPEYTGGMLPPGMEPSGELTSRIPSASERIYDYVRSSLGGDEETKGQRAETIMNILDQTPLAAGPIAYDVGRGISEIAGYAEGGSVKDEDSWLDAAMTVARNAADKATFGTSKYAAAGADYLTDAALDALGYENDADFDRALAEQEYAMKEGEEKNPAAAGAGDIIGYVAPYLAVGPAEGALTTLGYLSDYGGKVGKTGSLFARALGFADGGEVPEQGYLESVGTAINQAANPVRRLIGVRTVDLPEGVDEVDYEELMNLAADVLDKSMLGFGGADPYAKRPKKFPVSPTGKIVDRVLPEEDDIDGALRIAKDVGGGLTPEEVGRRAAQDPATFDAIMQKYAIPDRDIAEYEALKSTVAKQPQDIQQMTHVGAPPMRDVKVDMPLFGGEYNIGSAPYNVAQGMSGAAQTAYDFKTAPLYMTPMTAPIGAGLDVAEGVATGDPLQASMAALGAPGKMAKGAIIGLSNYAMDPAEAQAGRERFFSKLLRTAEELPMEKMTGQQALAMLRKGASPEELRWTGTEDFLANTPQVTKQNLIDYINKNRIQTEDVVLGGSKPVRRDDVVPSETAIASMKNRWDELTARNREITDQMMLPPSERRASGDQLAEEQIAITNEMDTLHAKMIDDTIAEMGGLGKPLRYGPGSKFGDRYSTPGGEDYRETLVSLPPEETVLREWPVVGGDGLQHGRYYDLESAQMAANRIAGGTVLDPVETKVISGYYGPHWYEPNVVAHIRSQILTSTPEGANRPYKVFNVDESQSDMAQDARKYGLKMSDDERQAIRNRIDEIRQERAKYIGSTDLDERSKYDFLAKEEDDLLKLYNQDFKKAVKNAPYIGSTQGWTDLSIKKSIDQALDSGADYFTFTPGEVQADRYSLARDLSHIEYEPNNDGTYLVSAINKDGKNVLENEFNYDDLEDHFGKEIAQKIKSDVGRKMEDRPLRDWRILDNEQIKAKGDKMVDYYENIYKRRVLKVIKDATGKKANWEKIPVNTANGVEMRDSIRLDDLHDARFSDFNKGGRVTGGNSYGNDQSIANALALTREY